MAGEVARPGFFPVACLQPQWFTSVAGTETSNCPHLGRIRASNPAEDSLCATSGASSLNCEGNYSLISRTVPDDGDSHGGGISFSLMALCLPAFTSSPCCQRVRCSL